MFEVNTVLGNDHAMYPKEIILLVKKFQKQSSLAISTSCYMYTHAQVYVLCKAMCFKLHQAYITEYLLFVRHYARHKEVKAK